MTPEPVLETTGLHKHFGKIHAVDGVTLSINRGEIYGLLGPNGSGNTTLIRSCLGLLSERRAPSDCWVKLSPISQTSRRWDI